jgi:hypothetical protein
MPLYYFRSSPDGSAETDRAVECPDLAAAKIHARRTLAGLAFDRILTGADVFAIGVRIENRAGRRLATLHLDASLRAMDAANAAGPADKG